MKKIVGIASIPSREIGLMDTLNSLSPQVDKIYVWLNGYEKTPTANLDNVVFHNGEDCGAVGKMKTLDLVEEDEFYFFMADDDIVYPSDYVSHNLKHYEMGTIQSSHGKIYKKFPILNYSYGDISGFYFGSHISNRVPIHVAGTGVSLTDHTVVRDIPYDSFLDYPNMLDVWVSSYCLLNDIPMFIVPHKGGWLRPNNKINQTDSIWETTKDRENEFRTKVFNQYISQI